MSPHACEMCHVVNASVEVYHYEEWEVQTKAWLCVECQKNALRFFVTMLLLGTIASEAPEDIPKAARDTSDRVIALAKKNRITEDYAVKLLTRETRRAVEVVRGETR